MKLAYSIVVGSAFITHSFAAHATSSQCTNVCAEVLPKCLARFDRTHCLEQQATCLAYWDTTTSPPYRTDGGATIIFPPGFGGPPPPPALARRAPVGLCDEACGQVLLACRQKNGLDNLRCKHQHVDYPAFCGGHPEIPPAVSTDGTVITIHPPVDPPSTAEARDHVCSDLCPEVLNACLVLPPEGTSDEFCDKQDRNCRKWCKEYSLYHPSTSQNSMVINFPDPPFATKPFTISTSTHPTPFGPTTETHTPPAPIKRHSERCQDICIAGCKENRALYLKRGVVAAICEAERDGGAEAGG